MSRRNRLGSGRHYEELLNGSRSDDSALSSLLDAARAPGTRDEVAGLPAARSAFMSSRYVRSRPAASVSKLPAATRSAAGRLLALKLLAAVSGATLIGGAAYAATGAKLLGSGPSTAKSATSSSASAAGSGVGSQSRGYHPNLGGGIHPTPAGPLPSPAQTRGHPGGVSSSARSEHSPTVATGHTGSPARSSHPPSPSRPSSTPHPSPTPHPPPTPHPSPTRHHTPTPHNTKPHRTPSAQPSSAQQVVSRSSAPRPGSTTQ